MFRYSSHEPKVSKQELLYHFAFKIDDTFEKCWKNFKNTMFKLSFTYTSELFELFYCIKVVFYIYPALKSVMAFKAKMFGVDLCVRFPQ